MKPAPGGHRNAPGSRTNGPGCFGQWGGQRCPPLKGKRARNCADFGAWATPPFGAEAELRLNLWFGSLMIMIVSMGALEQFGNKSTQEVWKVHVQVPEKCQHQANEQELKLKLRTGDHRLYEAD